MARTPHPLRIAAQRPVIWLSALLWSFPINVSTTTLAVFIGRQGSVFEVSMVTLSHFLALLLFAPIWGALADSTGKHRPILVGAGMLASFSLITIGLTDGVWFPILLRGVYAVFFAAFPPLMLTIVSEHGELGQRGRALGTFNSWRSIGFAAGQFAAGLSLVLLTYFEIYLLLGVGHLVATLVTWFVINPVPDRDVKPRVSVLLSNLMRRLYPSRDDRSTLKSHGLRWVYVAVGLQSVTFHGLWSLLPVYLTVQIGIAEPLMGAFLAINPLSRTVMMIVFGGAVERIGRKPVLGFGLIGTGLFAVVIASATVPESLFVRKLVVGIGFVVIAVSASAVVVGSQTFIGDIASVGRESELMGFHSTASGVGGVVGPVLLGGLVTLLSYDTAFVVLSLVSFSGALVIVRGVTETKASAGVASDD